MNEHKNPNEAKKEPAVTTPPPDDPEVTHITIVEPKKWTKANWIAVALFAVSLGLAIYNALMYHEISNNYQITNRPFVNLTPVSFINNGEVIEGDRKGDTEYKLMFRVRNHSPFPAFIDNIDIWIENILENRSTDLVIIEGDEQNTTNNFALFDEEIPTITWTFYFGKNHVTQLNNAGDPLYFVFKINYKILGDEKDLKQPAFSYWAKYKFNDFIKNKKVDSNSIFIKKCGVKDINPNDNEHKEDPVPKSESRSTDTAVQVN